MNAAEFKRILLFPSPNSPSLAGVVVTGWVEFVGNDFAHGIVLDNVTFQDPTLFRNCNILDHFVATDCCFEAGLDLSGSIFAHGATILDCHFGPEMAGQHVDDAVIVADHADVSGNLAIVTSTANGTVSLRSIRCRGDLLILNSIIECNGTSLPALDLTHAVISGDLTFGGTWSAFIRRSSRRLPKIVAFQRWLDKDGNTAPGNEALSTQILTARDESAKPLRFNNLDVGGAILLYDLICTPSIGLGNSRCKTFLLDRATIDGNLEIWSFVTGRIAGRGTVIGGTLSMIVGESGQIEFDDWSDERRQIPASVGTLIWSGWTCKEWACFGFATIGSTSPTVSPNGVNGVGIRGCTVADSVEFTRRSIKFRDPKELLRIANTEQGAAAVLGHWGSPVTIKHGFFMNHSKVDGSLDLTNVVIEGPLDLSDNVIGETLRMGTPTSFLDEGTTASEVMIAIARLRLLIPDQGHLEDRFAPVRTRAHELQMLHTQAGDIDLTGLVLPYPRDGRPAGSVQAADIVVRRKVKVCLRQSLDKHAKALTKQVAAGGDLARIMEIAVQCLVKAPERTGGLTAYLQRPRHLCRVHHRSHPVPSAGVLDINPASADIPGALNLEGARIGQLRLSAKSFEINNEDVHRRKSRECGIVLENADVQELCIYPLRPDGNNEGNGFPRPLSLNNLSVKSWKLANWKDKDDARPAAPTTDDETLYDVPPEANDATPYLDILDNDTEYRASLYLGIEKSLRDRGLDRAAREIYIASTYRDREPVCPAAIGRYGNKDMAGSKRMPKTTTRESSD